jgi:hypothetical protein
MVESYAPLPADAPLGQRVEAAVLEGHTEEAITLLRREGSITRQDAESIVERIQMGGYPAVGDMLRNVWAGKPPWRPDR